MFLPNACLVAMFHFRYIYYDGATTTFWEGLRNDLRLEELDMCWQDVLLERWPKLKAVIELKQSQPFTMECTMHAVWICTRNDTTKQFFT